MALDLFVSQKAHSALRWLIERQGTRAGDQACGSFAVNGKRFLTRSRTRLTLFGLSGVDEMAQEERHLTAETLDNISLYA